MGELSDQGFTSAMLEEAEKLGHLARSRAAAIVKQVVAEAGLPPGFYVIDSLCSAVGSPSLPTEAVVARIRDAGFRVARTHLDERGIRTDADIGELKRLLGG
jgi:tRNA (guanine26-N2/guanine27-N2)-dimethyltransferase